MILSSSGFFSWSNMVELAAAAQKIVKLHYTEELRERKRKRQRKRAREGSVGVEMDEVRCGSTKTNIAHVRTCTVCIKSALNVM